ncbi:MAG TPA: hypothetical protein VG713_12410 [Pirellulales bacterium]|nr:hypothetical protein [Pirellulales bacterium]
MTATKTKTEAPARSSIDDAIAQAAALRADEQSHAEQNTAAGWRLYCDMLKRHSKPLASDAGDLLTIGRDFGITPEQMKADAALIAKAIELKTMHAQLAEARAEAAKAQQAYLDWQLEMDRRERELFTAKSQAAGRHHHCNSARLELLALQRERPQLFVLDGAGVPQLIGSSTE